VGTIRVTSSSRTNYCAQCAFYTGPREKQGSYLVYNTDESGKCANKMGVGPQAGKVVKAQNTCSKFDRWNVF
jgi:hypothetical protein